MARSTQVPFYHHPANAQARGHATKLHLSPSFKTATWKREVGWLSSGVPSNSQSLQWWFGECREGHRNSIPCQSCGIILEVCQPMWHSVCMGFGIAKSNKCVQQSYSQALVIAAKLVFNGQMTLRGPWRVQFQRADSQSPYNISLYTEFLKNAYDLSDIVVFLLLLTKTQGKSQGRLCYCVPLLFRYINNQIWELPIKTE